MRLVFPGSSNFIQFEYIFINCRLRKSNYFFPVLVYAKCENSFVSNFPYVDRGGKKASGGDLEGRIAHKLM